MTGHRRQQPVADAPRSYPLFQTGKSDTKKSHSSKTSRIVADNIISPPVIHKIMHISAATLIDIPQLCDLLELLFSEEAEFHPDRDLQSAGLHQIIENPDGGRILVLREGVSIVGMVNLLFTISTALGGRVAILEDMIIHPAHRGYGRGSRLLQAAIELARAADCRRITLLTDRTNESAQRFYQRNGFTSSEMIPMRLLLNTKVKN